MTAAQKMPSTSPAPPEAYDEDDDRDEITIERRVKAPAALPTTRMTKVDSRLLAIARGELEADDPFGGLIPIYDNDDEAPLAVEDGWLLLDGGPESNGASEGLLADAVPTLRIARAELLALPLARRTASFAAQIDGTRTFEQLIALCALDELSGLEIVDELLRLGAIDLF